MNTGSEWKIWDLHIHTPASFHWKDGKLFSQMNDEEKRTKYKSIIEKIDSSELIAFCIVDYFTFDGVLEIRKFLDASKTKEGKTIFPGIELRIEAPTDYRLNIQVIFSEDITDQELKDFLSKLEILSYERPLSREAIIKYAKNLPSDIAKKHGCNKQDYTSNDNIAYDLGCKTIVITRESFEEATKSLGKNKCLIILPYDTSDGIEKLDWETHSAEDLYFFKLADLFESRKQENIDLFLGKKTADNEKFFDDFQQTMGGKPKPVLSGSDAHKVEYYGKFTDDKKTWLKADPTFKGLKQVTVEPASRCFIGERPKILETIKQRATKFISRIEIKKNADSDFEEIWFDNNIDFNPELIAIIGNKGSGKSALSDIIGLLGNSKQYPNFSFLNKNRFTERSGYKARHFNATMYWEDRTKVEKSLKDKYNETDIEKVKYIPQSHLEKICSELERDELNQELENTIFSHIPDDDRFGEPDLDSLLNFKTEEVGKEISTLRIELKEIIKNILDNRKKITPEYKVKLQNQLDAKQAEYHSIEQLKPQEIKKPANTDPDIQKQSRRLESLTNEEKKIKDRISSLKAKIETLKTKKAYLEKAIHQIKILEQSIKEQTEEINELLKNIDYRIGICTYQQEISDLNARLRDLENKKIEKEKQLREDLILLETKQTNIRKTTEKINEPNRKYQKYLRNIENWQQQMKSIKGDKNTPDTLEYIQGKLNDIDNIPHQILKYERKRDEIVSAIHKKIKEIVDIYKEIYKPIQKFVSEGFLDHDDFNITFDTKIINSGFKEKFEQLIDRSKAGTFYGIANSEQRLKELLDSYDFNDSKAVVEFVKKVFGLLECDSRDSQPKEVKFESQVKKEVSPEELYNMIFGLEYLKPEYSLRLNGKDIEQLSPGERGILLLIFYLMIDKDDRPLILDQPEENLDNQTIYKVLVPCIKKAKGRRQIFLVTHNPNLAVVCDAEQIIVASINKTEGNAVNYKSGAIEDPEINSYIVDILEGTKPAFQNREHKYHALSRE